MHMFYIYIIAMICKDLSLAIFYLQGPEQENTFAKWSRASPPLSNSQVDTLAFQQIEIDHYIGNNISLERIHFFKY